MWNRFLAKSTSLPEIFFVEETFDHVPGNKNVIINMQIWDEPCRLQTLPYDDTQGNINRRENRGKELKNVGMNFSPTCRQKPERH